jgi:hypothetical protein
MQVEASRISAEMKDNGVEVYTLAELMQLQEFETRAADIREAIESGRRELEHDRQNADQLNKDEIDQKTSEHKNSQSSTGESLDDLNNDLQLYEANNEWSADTEKPSASESNDVYETPRNGLSVAVESEQQEHKDLPKMSEDFSDVTQPKEPQEPAETTDADPEPLAPPLSFNS